MISMLRGLVFSCSGNTVILDVNGVGYSVLCPLPMVAELMESKESQHIILVETQVREDAITLFGFANESDKTWFNVLLGVQGIGGKTALAVLSHLGVEGLVQAVMSEDIDSVKAVPGIGAKTAQRLVVELSGAVEKMPNMSEQGNNNTVDIETLKMAQAALVKLGYSSKDSRDAIRGVMDGNRSDSKAVELQTLITAALMKMAR